MIDYKKENRETYEKYAAEFEENTRTYLQNYLLSDISLFLQNLKGNRILDVGSGPGRDAIFLKSKGLNPVCIDISSSMISLCKEKGLEVYIMDLENITLREASFDGIWAYTSLLHVPKKAMPNVLKKFHSLLKKKGILYLGMKEGAFEGFHEDQRYPNTKRFSALYKDEDLRKLLAEKFELLHHSQVAVENNVYLNYLCMKK